MKSIASKRALVTGAASGIGRAVANALARESAELYLLDIDQRRLEELAQELRSRGATVVARSCDLRDSDQLDACLDELLTDFRGVDIIVNNAGLIYYGGTVEMSDDQWDSVLAVNLLAPTRIVRRLLPTMKARGEGHIVNVCSIAGLVGYKKVSAYCLTKFGLVGFSESLRGELARSGIGVSAICPGFVDTKMHRAAMSPGDRIGCRAPSRWMCVRVEVVADRIVHAIRRNRFLTVITPLAHVLWLFKRTLPSMWPWIAGGCRRPRKAAATRHPRVAAPSHVATPAHAQLDAVGQ